MDKQIIHKLKYRHIASWSQFVPIFRTWQLMILACCLMGAFLSSCEKTDEFKEQLDGIPQISYSTYFKYKTNYLLGDTLKITGILYPEKGLQVQVGDLTDTRIVKTEKVLFSGSVGGRDSLDRVSVIITEAMGTGIGRPVIVKLGSNAVKGSPITIYTPVGEGSLSQPLKLSEYTSAAINRQNTYLHCTNGKGDVYYLGFSDKCLWHVSKNGVATKLLTGEMLKAGENCSYNTIMPFLAGGVNPQGTKAWISINTYSGYRFSEIDLQTKQVTVLNTSTAIAQPYQGNIGTVGVIINGIFPNSKGDVYLEIGTASGVSDNTQAIALYNSNTQKLSYLYKTYKAQAADLPGSSLDIGYYENQGVSFRFYPEDNILYAVHKYSGLSTGEGVGIVTTGISQYNLKTKFKAYTIKTIGGNEYIGSFSSLPIYMLNDVYGLLPVSDRRIVALYGRQEADKSLPVWLVFSFGEERTYLYAPGKADLESYIFAPTSTNNRVDEMLNYDEEGSLYNTANGREKLIKTVYSEH